MFQFLQFDPARVEDINGVWLLLTLLAIIVTLLAILALSDIIDSGLPESSLFQELARNIENSRKQLN